MKPSPKEAENLLDWAMQATGKLLGVYRDTSIARELQDWLYRDDVDGDTYNAMYWIVLAVGAQSCPEEKDELAEAYFRRGNSIFTKSKMDHANVASIQTQIWITFYLLHACRRYAATTSLTIAVRGAYAMGLHVFGCTSPLQEHGLFRERLWRTLRTLDLFISSSLGRPPSTYEIRNMESQDADTFINDLAHIHEVMLKEMHLKRGQSAQQFTYDMITRHQSWTRRLHTCTAFDDTSPVQKLSVDDGHQPNGPVKNVKQAYYWSIMLLTWPYLFRRASECSAQGRDNNSPGSNSGPSSLPTFGLIALSACVDSAVRTIDMLAELLSMPKLPKRLPYAINSIFVAALTLGTAVFANLDHDFPLDKSLRAAQKLLQRFQGYDPLAKRYLRTIGHLQAAGEAHVERRRGGRVETCASATTSALGMVDKSSRTLGTGHYVACQNTARRDGPAPGFLV
ncbi:hypothetical protein N0V95_005264 [Ascochyta clinopodiicola]|nr:hypothetical protein N0V95_005264 [Ascochyta clinopodiicola]